MTYLESLYQRVEDCSRHQMFIDFVSPKGTIPVWSKLDTIYNNIRMQLELKIDAEELRNV